MLPTLSERLNTNKVVEFHNQAYNEMSEQQLYMTPASALTSNNIFCAKRDSSIEPELAKAAARRN